MSRLVNIGAGEISDRLTVLALKILHARAAGKETKHWQDERNALLAQIRARTLNGSWFEQVLDLAAVNAALWQAEDELRARRTVVEQDDDEAARDAHLLHSGMVAFRIQELNDRRSELIEAINKQTGELLGKEKVS